MSIYGDVEPLLAGAASDISNVERITEEDADTEGLAFILADLRDLRTLVSEVYGRVEKRLLDTMTAGPKVEVPGLGVVVSHRKTKRTKWDHDSLLRVVVARALDERRLDEETGEYEREAEAVARVLRECVSLGAGKVTGLKARGLQPDEFCQEEPNGFSVELPPRTISERAA